jgi:hypothetical protein
MAFQRQLGLEPSGQIDQQTATALGLSIASSSGRSVTGPQYVAASVHVCDIGTIRRAGYVGRPARNWWKWRYRANDVGIWPNSWRMGYQPPLPKFFARSRPRLPVKH